MFILPLLNISDTDYCNSRSSGCPDWHCSPTSSSTSIFSWAFHLLNQAFENPSFTTAYHTNCLFKSMTPYQILLQTCSCFCMVVVQTNDASTSARCCWLKNSSSASNIGFAILTVGYLMSGRPFLCLPSSHSDLATLITLKSTAEIEAALSHSKSHSKA